MVSLEPVELLDHHGAGRERVRVLVWESARRENLGKARIRNGRLARILGGGNNEVVGHLSGALHALDRNAAAMRIAQEEAPGRGKLRPISGVNRADAQEEQ
ncbi:MAG TPA: hypothetical protein VKF83_12410 [Stellaceae bacterium]|nr:hypothetical protein [Stellaceae bacterium]